VRHDPAFVHRVAVETAARVIADAAPGHGEEGLLGDLAQPLLAPVVPARDQELARSGVGKLGRAPESAVADVEQSRHVGGAALEQLRVDRPALGLIERFREMCADGLGVARHLGTIVAVQLSDVSQDRGESRAAEGILLGREVGASEEDFAVGREERRERPTALARERLDGALVAGVHIRALVAVHLDAHECVV
jgi:hypothetical protein